MDPDLGVDPDPRWIRIQAIPIPALLDAIPDPDPDPAKNGILTPLVLFNHYGSSLHDPAFCRGMISQII